MSLCLFSVILSFFLSFLYYTASTREQSSLATSPRRYAFPATTFPGTAGSFLECQPASQPHTRFLVVRDLTVLIKHPNVATNYYKLSLRMAVVVEDPGVSGRNDGPRGVREHRPGICIQVASVSNPSPIIPVPRRLSADAIG